MESRRNLTRFTYTNAAFQGWRLCLSRKGHTFTQYFSDKQFGGEERSLAAAEKTLGKLKNLINADPKTGNKLSDETVQQGKALLKAAANPEGAPPAPPEEIREPTTGPGANPPTPETVTAEISRTPNPPSPAEFHPPTDTTRPIPPDPPTPVPPSDSPPTPETTTTPETSPAPPASAPTSPVSGPWTSKAKADSLVAILEGRTTIEEIATRRGLTPSDIRYLLSAFVREVAQASETGTAADPQAALRRTRRLELIEQIQDRLEKLEEFES